jgi:hypothetical protein
MSDQSQKPPVDDDGAPKTRTVQIGGEVGSTGAVATPSAPKRVEVGQAIPGQPPAGFPTGGDVDMYGDPIEYAPEDPKMRTGDPNEHPPPDAGGSTAV